MRIMMMMMRMTKMQKQRRQTAKKRQNSIHIKRGNAAQKNSNKNKNQVKTLKNKFM